MARIRSIKPEMRTSLLVAGWPREVRYAFVLMLGYLDDYGRGVDDMRLVVADCFPLDRDVTARKMDSWIRLMESGPICRYEVDGRRFLHAINWKEHQRISHPTASRVPPCPVHEQGRNGSGRPPEPFPNDSGAIPENIPNGSAPRVRAEQGKGAREGSKGAGNARAARSTTNDRVQVGLDLAAKYDYLDRQAGLRALPGGAA